MRAASGGWISRSLILLLLCCQIVVSGSGQASPGVGFLAIAVTIGDDRVPATSAYVFVRAYRPVYNGESSMVPRASHDGYFETALAPGIYDIFVSEVSSLPLCKRVEIVTGQTEHYTANLKIDHDHLEQ